MVVLVVVIFLQTWRASIIPLLAVPVSIVGTFAVLLGFGFSINTLTLLALVLVCAGVGYAWAQVHDGLLTKWLERATPSAGDEIVILSLTLASLTGLALAIINRVTKLGLLSKLAEQVTFVLMPPLILIFLVLGTIFLGVATPTEGGAMGALGAIILALGKGRLSFSLTKQALENTAKLASFVLFILIGSTVFSFTFNAADGHIWVEHLFDKIGRASCRERVSSPV